jgi:hypothetical protein
VARRAGTIQVRLHRLHTINRDIGIERRQLLADGSGKLLGCDRCPNDQRHGRPLNTF